MVKCLDSFIGYFTCTNRITARRYFVRVAIITRTHSPSYYSMPPQRSLHSILFYISTCSCWSIPPTVSKKIIDQKFLFRIFYPMEFRLFFGHQWGGEYVDPRISRMSPENNRIATPAQPLKWSHALISMAIRRSSQKQIVNQLNTFFSPTSVNFANPLVDFQW